MKTLRISIVALAAFALFLATSCEKIDFTEDGPIPQDSTYMAPVEDPSKDLNPEDESEYLEKEKLPEV